MKNSNNSRVVNTFIVVIIIIVLASLLLKLVFVLRSYSKHEVNTFNTFKHVDISTCSSLSGALLSELRAIADKTDVPMKAF